MKKSEKEKLAQIAAECIYGESADYNSSQIGQRILKAFPVIEEDFSGLADINAAYRVASKLIARLTSPSGRGTDYRTQAALHRIHAEIAEVIDQWCEDQGKRAVELVDKMQSIDDLMRDVSLKESFELACKYNEEFELLTKLL
ncbi:hypothetical protein [Undibacterium oligocarboniphilum]|uniref:Uncharacterized protein n=1 Tax=Undibacterium oligocarboniphilum TaxID=666702 RepID=A0A850QI03_9BURK|nr:hypothetical protein [Undibacterium oligocarboniphilum]MBC3871506.1 hypothetical protein [Undibacterium oligocarboniphilum]NVO78918.1 hypothetical protein [Undibacterium oligocarboniphilum]